MPVRNHGSLKNILLGQPFDQAWFDRVVECCCLAKVDWIISYVVALSLYQLMINLGYQRDAFW